MTLKFTTSYLQDSIEVFRYYKKLAERAMEQVKEDQLTAVLDNQMNSIAIIVKHMAGNMRSRWADFLTSDGEKPDRNRDTEFVDAPVSRDAIQKTWEEGWETLFAAIFAAVRSRPWSNGSNSRRAPFGDASYEPPNRALCLPLRTDRVIGEAFSG